jgi:metallo-beta-lactamase family protein
MKITFWGAARTVTGSMHILHVNDKRVLLECGMYQGKRKVANEINRNLPFESGKIDAMILSHAHIDHSGIIPRLVADGYEGNIFATMATCDLCSIMLRDSAHIQERDAEFLNRRKKKRGEPLVEPIYTMEEAKRSLDNFVGLKYGRPFFVTNGVKATFYDAGHILGSAVVLIEATEGDRTLRILFTGDLGRENMPILEDPTVVKDADALIMEATYGNRLHDGIVDMESKLQEVVSQTVSRGGKIIIPAFSVGRTQNIVYSLHGLFDKGELPAIPIFVDSPLSTNATEIFRMHPECYDEEAFEMLRHHKDPFGFGRLQYTANVEESKRLNSMEEPCIIISASGMCEAGRILHHLKNNIGDPKNTILIVGYQAENTSGRRLVEKHKRVRILGQEHDVRAEVRVMNGYSAHADKNGLLAYAQSVDGTKLRVFVVHGDEDQCLALGDNLGGAGFNDVNVPGRGETFEL